MVATVSGTLVMSVHLSCQLGSFMASISLAWRTPEKRERAGVKQHTLVRSGVRLSRTLVSVRAYFLVEVANLIREHAVFVRQETEASLFFQQGLSAAVSDELLHVCLS